MRQAEADVCLLLEGTYPYVTGGVSSWVHQIITRMPDVRFALQYIGASREPALEMRYTLPANVVAFESMYLFDEPLPAEPARLDEPGRGRLYGALAAMHEAMRDGEVAGPFHAVLAGLAGAGGGGSRCPMHRMKKAPNLRNLLADREAWDLLTRLYDERCPGESFIDYFWTFRFMHLPIWQVMAASRRVPAARVYHTVSTGYAGLLGAVLRALRGRPLLLTEHGIYTKERKIEIAQAEWIHAARQQGFVAFQGLGYLKELWTRCFGFMGRAAYEAADAITTLYDGNRRMQIEHGAPPEKIQVIPNGIDVEELGKLAAARASASARPTVGFVGRLVPIKDVKTLIRATKIAVAAIPDLEVLIAGPTDEDPAYTRECMDLVASLELGGHVRFLGKQDVARVYPRIDVLALSSISEALPLVILEAQAAGVPVVATDVGACRELLGGRGREDRALGPSGLLVAIADPEEMAGALVRLLRDPALRARLAAAGGARVGRYYRQSDIIERYRALYRRHIESAPAAAAAGAEG